MKNIKFAKNKKAAVITTIIAILLIVAIVAVTLFLTIGGESGKNVKKVIVIRKENTTSDESGSEDSSEDESLFDKIIEIFRPRRELYQKETKERYVEVFSPEYTVSYSKWDGPNGYKIIFPKGNAQLEELALELKDYIQKQYEIEVLVASDSDTEVSKEILIGKTNRKVEVFSKESEFAVELVGSKLLFNGAHYVSVNKAIDAFVSQEIKQGYVSTLKGSFDFSSTLENGYNYMWGDEFDGTLLDAKKWGLDSHMAASVTMKLDSENCIKVADGRLKLFALHYFDETDPNVEYAVPFSLNTKNTMSFQYGYLEMRARVPFEVGAWPSLWCSSRDSLGPHTPNLDYSVEVDIFEVFASEDTLQPNTHKHYFKEMTDHSDTQGGFQPDGSPKKNYTFKNSDTLSNEYHIYGFEWTPKTMTMYVDGEAYTTIDITKSYDDNEDMRGFTDPLYLRLNNHLFVPDTYYHPYAGSNADPSELPFEYFIDYIRLYQKPGNGNLYLGE